MTDEKKAEKPLVRVAWQGILTEFRLHTDATTGAVFVRLPTGKRAYVVERRDGTYIVKP